MTYRRDQGREEERNCCPMRAMETDSVTFCEGARRKERERRRKESVGLICHSNRANPFMTFLTTLDIRCGQNYEIFSSSIFLLLFKEFFLKPVNTFYF